MIELEQDLRCANDALKQEFYAQTINELQLPEIEVTTSPSGDIVPYVVMGDINEATNVVFVPAPYSVPVTDDRVKINLMSQQKVLGSDFCVVGMHVYDPHDARLSRSQRQEIRGGSFRPLAERMLSVVGVTANPDKHKVTFFGYSMGADVVTEAAHGIIFDENMGVVDVANLGVFEPARVLASRSSGGRLMQSRLLQVKNMTDAFASSGEDLYANVTRDMAISLLDANGIDTNDPDAKKKFDKRVEKYVVRYVLADIAGSWALNRGFVHDTTIIQLDDIDVSNSGPFVTLGHATNSTIFPGEVFAHIPDTSRRLRVQMRGDHSLGDSLDHIGAMARVTTTKVIENRLFFDNGEGMVPGITGDAIFNPE